MNLPDSSAVQQDVTRPLSFVAGLTLSSPADLGPGTRLGHFILLRKIGAGGMGTVFLAQQTAPIERQVALKLVQPDFQDTLGEAMFLVEQQALARLEHPAIARVYEAGSTSRGALFFAMEWIDGERLDRYCEKSRLGLRQILQLLLQVCRGVQHAHLKGILHRDLKPANLLVQMADGEPQAKIIDFGIATAPGTGNLRPAGTAGYMSPEQTRAGDLLDVRTDVYSLGVILLELSMRALGVPFSEGWWRDSTARFDSLRQLGAHSSGLLQPAALPRLPQELRAVVIKAIHPERESRYASVDALAADLRNLIEDRPVSAMPPHSRYLIGKFVRRHRAAVSASALMLLVLLGALVFAWVGWQRAERAARSAEISAGFLRSILAEVDPERAQGSDTRLLRQLLDAAAQRVATELNATPEVRAQIQTTIADSYRGIGEAATARILAQQAYDAATTALGADHHATRELKLALVRAATAAGELDAARNLAEAHWQQSGSDTVASAETALEHLQWAEALVRLRRQQGQIAAAIELGQQAMIAVQADLDPQPGVLVARLGLQVEVGVALAAAGQFDAAVALLENTVNREQVRAEHEPFDLLKIRGELGVILFIAKRYAEARALFQAILPEHIRILGPEHPATLSIRGNLAATLSLSGDPAAAAEVTRELIALRERVNGPDHPETLIAIGNYAAALLRSCQYPLAEQAFQRYVSLCEKLHGSSHPSCAERLAGLGKAKRAQGRWAEAETDLLESWRRKQQVEGKQFASAEVVAAELAELYRLWQRPEQVQIWAGRAQNAERSIPECAR